MCNLHFGTRPHTKRRSPQRLAQHAARSNAPQRAGVFRLCTTSLSYGVQQRRLEAHEAALAASASHTGTGTGTGTVASRRLRAQSGAAAATQTAAVAAATNAAADTTRRRKRRSRHVARHRPDDLVPAGSASAAAAAAAALAAAPRLPRGTARSQPAQARPLPRARTCWGAAAELLLRLYAPVWWREMGVTLRSLQHLVDLPARDVVAPLTQLMALCMHPAAEALGPRLRCDERVPMPIRTWETVGGRCGGEAHQWQGFALALPLASRSRATI